MPSTGTPGNIWYPDDTSPVAPLENLFLTLATSVNVALAAALANGWARGQATQYICTTPAALDAITDAVVGDIALMTTPGTGMDVQLWYCWGGTGAGVDWRPVGELVASSKANMDAFIAVIAAIADTRFEVGQFWLDTSTNLLYQFTSDVGAYRRYSGSIALLPTIVGTGGTSARDAVTGDVTFSGAITVLDAYVATAIIAAAKWVDISYGYLGASGGNEILQFLSGTGVVDASSNYDAGYSVNFASTASADTRATTTSFAPALNALRNKRRSNIRAVNMGAALPTEATGTFSVATITAGVSSNRGNGAMELNHLASTAFGGVRLTLGNTNTMGSISNGTLAMVAQF